MAYTAAFPQSGSSLHLLESKLLVHLIQDRPPALGDSPILFKKCFGIFKLPHIGLVEVGRLGQQLNLRPHPRTEGSSDRRWKALLTYGSGIRYPAGNWTQAALVRGQHANHSATWAPTNIKSIPFTNTQSATVPYCVVTTATSCCVSYSGPESTG